MATQKLPTLPNGLPAWQMLHLKSTDEKCQIVKINEAVKDTKADSETFGQIIKPLTVIVKITRMALNIPYDVHEIVLPDELEVWNEAMNPTKTVEWTTRKGKKRSVVYSRTM